MERESAWKKCDEARIKDVFDFCEGYRKYISECKTERECVREAVKLAKACGFKRIAYITVAIIAGRYTCKQHALVIVNRNLHNGIVVSDHRRRNIRCVCFPGTITHKQRQNDRQKNKQRQFIFDFHINSSFSEPIRIGLEKFFIS